MRCNEQIDWDEALERQRHRIVSRAWQRSSRSARAVGHCDSGDGCDRLRAIHTPWKDRVMLAVNTLFDDEIGPAKRLSAPGMRKKLAYGRA